MSTLYRVRYRTVGESKLREVDPIVMRSFPVAELDAAREVNNRHGQQHRTGWYASKKAGRSLKFESGLERLRMMFLDFDPAVTTYAAQPFTLVWQRDGKTYCYTPDLLIVRPGQGRTVEDVKPERFRTSKKNFPAFQAAEEALSAVDIDFKVWSRPHPVLCYNVQYLAGYRRVPIQTPELTRTLLGALSEGPLPLGVLAAGTGQEMLARPVLYHLLWNHRLHADLDAPLEQSTLIHRSEAEGRS